MDFTKFLAKHKGKAAGGTLAIVLYLLARGCDVSIHVDPVKARQTTNAAAAEPIPPTP